ncbi:hypothetical protein [Persephonella sp.]
MFFISKWSPLFFLLAFINLVGSLILRIKGTDHIDTGLIAVFGFVLYTLIGAGYQIIPNSQQRQIKYKNLQGVVFLLAVISSVLMISGQFFYASIFNLITILVFTVHITAIIHNVQPVTVKFLLASIVYANIGSLFFFLSELSGHILLQTVIHTINVGVLLNAVIGVELAWIPMMLMHSLNIRMGNIIFWLHQISALTLIGAFYFFDYKFILLGGIFEAVVLLMFFYVIFSAVKSSKALMKVQPPIKFFLGGHIFLISGILMGLHIAGSKMVQFIPVHMDAMVYGFAALTIFGGTLHLMPRIVWNMVHIKKAREGKTIPNVFQIIDQKEANISFYLMMIATAVMIVLDFMMLHNFAAGIYIVTSLYFFYILFVKMFIFYIK